MRPNPWLALATMTLALSLNACGDKDDDDDDDTASDDSGDAGGDGDDSGDDSGNRTGCWEVDFIDGNSGTYTASAGESDVKHHFMMPEDIATLTGTVTWDEPEWTMEWSAGTGTCPDSGQEHCVIEGSGGTLSVTLAASELGLDTFEAGDKWFGHMGMVDGAETGDSTPYTMAFEVCTADDR